MSNLTHIFIPSLGLETEKILIGNWVVQQGALVEKGETICEIETDKAIIEIEAPTSGPLNILKAAGEVVGHNEFIGTIETL